MLVLYFRCRKTRTVNFGEIVLNLLAVAYWGFTEINYIITQKTKWKSEI